MIILLANLSREKQELEQVLSSVPIAAIIRLLESELFTKTDQEASVKAALCLRKLLSLGLPLVLPQSPAY